MPRMLTLYRPVGPQELALIAASGFRAFPPRLPEQPIFYPVLTLEYATAISTQWNVREKGVSYVVRFAIPEKYARRFPVQVVGSRRVHRELWVPAEQLDAFNAKIVGAIEVIAEHR